MRPSGVLTLYIQKDLQEAFEKLSKDKRLSKSTIINYLLRKELSEEGCL